MDLWIATSRDASQNVSSKKMIFFVIRQVPVYRVDSYFGIGLYDEYDAYCETCQSKYSNRENPKPP